ncbi:MAG: hypothetical protein OEV21_06895 [Thermoplasmata archaeon]|nr:hypothetical protein [Thermoplasmata archaeon]
MVKIDVEIVNLLQSLQGVEHAGVIDADLRGKLLREEERYASLGPIAVDNLGMKSALRKQKLYFIIKDRKFRPPPIPTVQLIAQDGEVLGEEIIGGRMPSLKNGERLFHIGKSFIIYITKARRKGKNSQFILPPVPFPEIELFDFAKNIVSASPSTLGDMEIKKSIGIDDDPRLASILVGFDIS